MRITCPFCSALYDVPMEAAQRRVRCARCAGEWLLESASAAPRQLPKQEQEQDPVSDFPAETLLSPTIAAHPFAEAIERAGIPAELFVVPTIPAAGETADQTAPIVAHRPLAIDRLVGEPAVSTAPRRKPVAVLWALSLIVVGGAIAAAYVRRDDVMQAWPPSRRIYDALDLDPVSPR